MDKNLFQNDHITGNSMIGLDFKGQFKDDENILIQKLKDVLNRNVTFSNIDYKLLEPTDNNAVLIKNSNFYEIKTPMYSYFEIVFILPKIMEFLASMKDYKDSYLYFRIGFNEKFCDLSQINITKFILEFNEDYILKNIVDNSKDGTLEKLTDIKPCNLEACGDDIKKQLNSLRFNDEDIYGIDFNAIKLGYITFKYAKEINYRSKWEQILKGINHTIITLYNSCTVTNFNDAEINKLDGMNKSYKDTLDSFGCYELFKNKFPKIKITKDLNPDITEINIIFPSIKEKLFDLVIRNGIREAEVNYDSDISKLQLKNLELKKCYHINGIDIVDSELENCSIKDCDIFDTKIEKSFINKCNIFGYANCKDTKFKDSYISRNIHLTDCNVFGTIGKMGGSMKGGTLRDTTVIMSMAEISDDVKKDNVNEIQ